MLFTFEPEETQILVSFNDQAIIGELRECWGDAASIQVVLLISYCNLIQGGDAWGHRGRQVLSLLAVPLL